MKYSVPVSYIFFCIMNSFQTCWTSSGSFLEAYVPVLLTCYAITKKSHATDIESDTLEVIFQSLQHKVPNLLLNALSKPDIIEKPAITELLLILSFIHDPSKINEYFNSIVSDSIIHLFESVVNALVVKESEKEASSSEVSLFSVSPPPSFDVKYSACGIPFITFEIESLIEAAKILQQRTEKLNAFFTQTTLPKFANHQESISYDFESLGYKIALIFTNHDPRPTDQQTFRFLSYYRNIHRMFGGDPKTSAEKIFKPLVLSWINDFGPQIIEWTSRAIQFDDFSVIVKSNQCSSSVIDLFRIFNETVQFIENLQFNEEEVKKIYGTYMSLCASSVKLYIITTVDLLKKRLQSLENPQFKPERHITPAQSFVIINNILMVNEQWNIFSTTFVQTHNVTEFPNPVFELASNIKKAIREFELQAILIIKNTIMEKIWNKRFAFKSDSYTLKLKNEDEPHEVAGAFITGIREFICDYNLLARTFQNKFIASVFRGVEKGIFEVFMPFFKEPNNIVYNKLLSILYNSIIEIINDLPDNHQKTASVEIQHIEFARNITRKSFEELMEVEIPEEDPLSSFVLDLTTVQIASSKSEKSKASAIISKYEKFSFIQPIASKKQKEKK
jgi:Fe-S-cluster formation regulator IscX/YfhJ